MRKADLISTWWACRDVVSCDIAPDDVVAGVLGYSGIDSFSSSKKFIHTAFRAIWEEYHADYPELLGDFLFSSGAHYPYCDLLAGVFMRLQIAGILSGSIRHKEFNIEPSAKAYILANCEKRLTPYIETLKKMGAIFAKKHTEIGGEE